MTAPLTETRRRGDLNDPDTPRVLIAEDDPHSRWALSTLMKRLGFHCQVASDGEEVLRLVEEFRPHVILMDLMMPRLDGVEATRRLKADARTRDIPVLVMTGNIAPTYQQLARSAGCDDLMPKPLVLRDLLERLDRFVSRPA